MSRCGAATAAALLAGVVGCGQPPPDQPEEQPVEPRSSVYDPLVGTLDRAESVQQTVDERAAELRRQLEEAEGQ